MIKFDYETLRRIWERSAKRVGSARHYWQLPSTSLYFSFRHRQEPMEMMLCEQDHVILRAGQPYIFRVDMTCPKCVELDNASKIKH